MTSKTLQYVLYQRKVTFGKHRGKSMQVARLTGRYQVDFERFCSLVARNPTIHIEEVKVHLRPSKRYFTLEDIHFRKAPRKAKKSKA